MRKMLLVLGLCCVLTTTNGLSTVRKKILPTRIVGGQDAKPGDFPYQVSFRYRDSHVCGGSLVIINSNQYVITGAHCVDSGAVDDYTVIAGEVNRFYNSSIGQVREVSYVIPHENFNGWTFANNIAIAALMEPFKIDGYVAPIPLPERFQETTEDVIISGWGTTANGGPVPDILQYVRIPVVDDKTCQEAYTQETILDSMICAGVIGEGGRDSCQGDSGGPLRAVYAGYLAGIIAWGYGCAEPQYPGVNIEVSHYIDWLNRNARPSEQRI